MINYPPNWICPSTLPLSKLVRNLLDMTRSVPAPNTNKQAAKVRNCLMRKFWSEKQQ